MTPRLVMLRREAPKLATSKRRPKRSAESYRSGLEKAVTKALEAGKATFAYEPGWVKYIVPEHVSRYLPDYVLGNGIIVEAKGQFVANDRKKHLLVKAQHPDLDIRFVFSNPMTRISKISKTTYAAWCESNGFLYARLLTPQAWIDEPPEPRRITAAKAVGIVLPGWN